jgi:parallel beta-helix repeat protein
LQWNAFKTSSFYISLLFLSSSGFFLIKPTMKFFNIFIMNKKNAVILIGLFLYFTMLSWLSTAQPSGGPYGPLRKTYELPNVSGKIFYVAPDGKDENQGESINKPTTIEQAVKQVKTGDAIILRGGIYRTGNLVLNQGIIMQPYKDEQPIFKGTYVATEWKNLGNGLWTTTWTKLFPSKPADWWQRDRQGKITPLYKFNNDMVFIDGKFLQAVGWEGEVNENSYYIDYESGRVYIGTDPTNRLVEITAFDVAILRTTRECHGKVSDKKGPAIRGITFTQYAYRAIEIEGTDPEGLSNEANHGKEVTGTILEHCTISFCSRVAAYLRGDKLIIRNCKISDTSTEGIYILSSSDVLLENNIFTRNNIEFITGYYPAAVKIFNQCYRVTCRDNLVIDLPYSNGIWYDVGNVDGIFINNWIENVGLLDRKFTGKQTWPSESGFFYEISKGVICAGNVFVNCENGIHILNSSNARIYNNTFINSTAVIGRNERSAVGDHFGWHPSTGPDVHEREGHIFVNNLLVADASFKRPLLFVWQPKTLCEKLNKPPFKQIDYNVYSQTSDRKDTPLILWSPFHNDECQTFMNSPQDLHNLYPEFSLNDAYYIDYQIFKSIELGNYQIIPSVQGKTKALPLPRDISLILGNVKNEKPYNGAFPSLQKY